jgi:transcriptional regulator with GAF, ATPase, and Fis domain
MVAVADLSQVREPQGTVWDAVVPVGPEGQPVGFIAVGPKLSGAAIDDSDHALLSIIAGQLATAWRNIEHVREIQQQRDEIQNLQKRAEAENIVLRAEVRSATQFTEIIGASPALRSVLQFVEQVGPSDATVLITGETGTGKELVARALHDVSPRGYRPMICVNCPAIPADLAESELFGHERGAFTGAVETRPGKFEMSDNGTLFLDEIGDLPMSIQVKLLRALQEREIQRIGSHKTLKLNLRVIAATNRDLREAVAEGTFREDLFFRLCAVQIHVPSLRERLEDVPVLAAYFLQRAADRYQKEIFGFTADAVASLERYDWPGNIRELQHVVERAALLCSSDRIRPEQLGDLAAVGARPRSTLNASLQAEKRRRVETALEQAGGNQAAAARALGMSRSNFGRLMKSLGMKRPRD